MKEPQKLYESFKINWLLTQVQTHKISCFEGKTPSECEQRLRGLKKEGYDYIRQKNGILEAV